MKPYKNVDVELTYQNFGSAWLGVLRGATENLELVFNGLFNFCATNGDLTFNDHTQCVATFWSSPKAMRRFFFNQHYLPRYEGRRHPLNGKLVRQAMRHAQAQMALLNENHEPFMKFDGLQESDTFVCGKVCAEKPDSDMKDAILAHAFANKDSEPQKTVDID